MTTSPRSKLKTSQKLKSGPAAGHAKMSATRTPSVKASAEPAADSSSHLQSLLEQFDRLGLSWRMSRASSAQTEESAFESVIDELEEIGYMGVWFTCNTLSAGLPHSRERVFLVGSYRSELSHQFYFDSGELLRDDSPRKARGTETGPDLQESLSQTLRFWSNVAEALGTPKQRAIAPRYAPKLESIKEATLTDQYYVARNLTWNECEKLMGFPEGWTVGRGRLIGNAVAPPIAEFIGRRILAIQNTYGQSRSAAAD